MAAKAWVELVQAQNPGSTFQNNMPNLCSMGSCDDTFFLENDPGVLLFGLIQLSSLNSSEAPRVTQDTCLRGTAELNFSVCMTPLSQTWWCS